MEKVGFSIALQGRLFACVIIVSILVAATAGADYSGGSGTEGDPWQIATPEDLIALGQNTDHYDRHFIMTADIDLIDYIFDKAVIAPNPDVISDGFDGVFNGDGHRIINLRIDHDEYEFWPHLALVGLFGAIDFNGEVRNLSLTSFEIAAIGDYVGAIAATNAGIIADCHVAGGLTGRDRVGGICGTNYGTISRSSAAGSVTGRYYIGGLVGRNYNGTITESFSASQASGSQSYVGGLVGENRGVEALISACYATGDVSGHDYIGGFCGYNSFSTSTYTPSVITQSYSTGEVICRWYPLSRGFCGYDGGYGRGFPIDGFWDTQTSGTTFSNGGTGKTTAEMQTLSTFTDAGWDFEEVWTICEGTNYPRFQWQILDADFLCPFGVDFRDFAHVSEWWGADDCGLYDDCDGADLNGDGAVDILDVLILAEQWLQGL